MPIAFTCPHCGKQFSVADQFAGQSGPCAACGQPITIPVTGSASPFAPQSGQRSGTSALTIVMIVLLVGAVAVIPCLIALLLPAVQAAREAARRMQASNNLKQLTLAMQNYHDVYGSIPPAVVTDADGNPLYSGRVLLLPFMEQKPLYDSFNKDEAWDSPANLPFTQQTLQVFTHPSAPPSKVAGQTDFVFVTGKGTIF